MEQRQIELGCGANKRPGFFGIDKYPAPGVDLVLDIETNPLPFPDDSVDHVYCSHAFEHLEHPSSPLHPLREICRVARDNALVEIWTPHGGSDDGLLLGHRNFYTETVRQHVCHLYPDFYLGDSRGRFAWVETQCVIEPGLVEKLDQLGVPLELAVRHFRNVILEFGVLLRVRKTGRAQAHQERPVVRLGYSRKSLVYTLPRPVPDRAVAQPTPVAAPEAPLRHRMVDQANDRMKLLAPSAHRALRAIFGRFSSP